MKRYILFFVFIFAVFIGIHIPKASALSCAGPSNSNQCNINCSTNQTFTETPGQYIDYVYREGTMSWDDYVTWGLNVNYVAVNTDNHGAASCGTGGAGSGTVDGGFMYFMPGNSTDSDIVVPVMTAFQRRTSDSNPYGGTVNFDVHYVACSAGQIVSNNSCQPVTGSITVALHDPACTGSCPVDISWSSPSGGGAASLNKNVVLYEKAGSFYQPANGLSGSTQTPSLSVGTYNFCLQGYDGNNNPPFDLSCQSVTVPAAVGGAKTATMSLSQTSFAYNQNNVGNGTVGSGTISATNIANSGSFTITACNISSNFPPSATIIPNCPPTSQVISANNPASYSESISNLPTSGGPYSYTLQIQAAGNGGTAVSNATQPVSVSYTPTITPVPSCFATPGTVNTGQNTTLFGSGGDGTNYTWSASGGNFSSTSGQQVTVSFSTAGQKNVTVSSGGQTSSCAVIVGTPPPPSGLSCSPATQTNYTFTGSGATTGQYAFSFSATGGNGTYTWSNSSGATPASGSGANYSMTQSGEVSNGTATVSSGGQTADCCYGAGIAADCGTSGGGGGGAPPSTNLYAATDGYLDVNDYPQGSWGSSLFGYAPVNGVDLRYTPAGGSSWWVSGGNEVTFECFADGNINGTVDRYAGNQNDTYVTVFDTCNYPTPGIYTAKATNLTKYNTPGVGGNTCLTPGGCILSSDTIQITVSKTYDFNFNQAAWNIPLGTPRYRADYDYNGDGFLNKTDQDQLQTWVTNSTACPAGKTCDINGSGTFNAADVTTYATYLQTTTIYTGGANQTATMYMTSPGGATVAMTATGAPAGSAFSPASVAIPANGSGTSLFTVPGNAAVGTYNIVPKGTTAIQGLAHSSSLTLTVAAAPVCPAGSVSLAPSTVTNGATSLASAPAGFSGGSFASSNQVVATVSGGTLSTHSTGSSNISGSGWNNSNGATSCTLSSAPLTVTSAVVNGACGTANKTYPAGANSYGSDTYCAAGNPSATPAFPTGGGSVNWTCNGINGGTNSAQCTATEPASLYSVNVSTTAGGSVTSGDGAISCGNTCAANYPDNTVVTLTATPTSSYWKFVNWSGDCSGSGQCVLTTSGEKTVSATFAPRSLNYQEF